jgi:hypothetical protein
MVHDYGGARGFYLIRHSDNATATQYVHVLVKNEENSTKIHTNVCTAENVECTVRMCKS